MFAFFKNIFFLHNCLLKKLRKELQTTCNAKSIKKTLDTWWSYFVCVYKYNKIIKIHFFLEVLSWFPFSLTSYFKENYVKKYIKKEINGVDE